METSSVNSSFRFEGYKIDRINFSTFPSVQFLNFKSNLPVEGWKFEFGIRQPTLFKSSKQYVGGLDATLTYPKPEQKNTSTPYEANQNMVSLSIGIAGLFSVEADKFEKDTEDNLVKLQIPTILFPYLRSTVTSIFANAGLGSIIFPLVNVYDLAKSVDLTISEIE